MEGTLTIASRSIRTQAQYVNSAKGLRIDNLSYNEDALTGNLTTLNGDFYKTADNTWVGRFDGSLNGDKMKYSFSGLDLDDMADVKECLADIEEIIAEQDGGEGGES